MKTKTSILFVSSAFSIGFALSAFGQPSGNNNGEIYPLVDTGFATDMLEDKFGSDEGYYYLSRQVFTNQPIPEILSDKEDVQGNWGEPVDGMQLSIRFRQSEFLSNQPVMAVVILRNLTSKPRTLMMSDKMWQFDLTHGTNVLVWKTIAENMRVDNGMFADTIKPHSEGFIVAHINRFFPFSEADKYSLRVRIFIQAPGDRDKISVISGNADFRIVDELSPAETAAIDERNKQIKAFLKKISP